MVRLFDDIHDAVQIPQQAFVKEIFESWPVRVEKKKSSGDVLVPVLSTVVFRIFEKATYGVPYLYLLPTIKSKHTMQRQSRSARRRRDSPASAELTAYSAQSAAYFKAGRQMPDHKPSLLARLDASLRNVLFPRIDSGNFLSSACIPNGNSHNLVSHSSPWFTSMRCSCLECGRIRSSVESQTANVALL